MSVDRQLFTPVLNVYDTLKYDVRCVLFWSISLFKRTSLPVSSLFEFGQLFRTRRSLEIQLDTVSLLVGHLRRYVNLPADGGLAGSASRSTGAGAGGAPLLLNICLGSMGEIVEPLPLFLGCLHRMLVSGRESLAEHARSGSSSGGGGGADPENILGGDDDVDGAGNQMGAGEATAAAEALRETLDELDNDLRRLSTALADCPLEEFNLDKVVDFCPNGGLDARKKLATAALLCGSYEALMQGSLLLTVGGVGGGDPRPVALMSSPVGSKLPSPPSIRGLLGLFDRRQTLLSLVRPSLPTASQQRAKKGSTEAASSGQSSTGFGSLAGDGESCGGGGGVGGGGGGLPGFSAGGCFGLTLYPGGMPCLGMTFVEDMLAVLNIDKTNEQAVSDDEETEGDTERDPGLIDVDAADGDPPTQVSVLRRGSVSAFLSVFFTFRRVIYRTLLSKLPGTPVFVGRFSFWALILRQAAA